MSAFRRGCGVCFDLFDSVHQHFLFFLMFTLKYVNVCSTKNATNNLSITLFLVYIQFNMVRDTKHFQTFHAIELSRVHLIRLPTYSGDIQD